MTVRLGNGLPSTLTPERIQSVLRFAKNHERELRETLDRDKTSVWRQTNSGENFYDRLHDLLRTVEGRKAYEIARGDFEKAKRKRSGRADLLRRLWKDISAILFHSEEFVPIHTDKFDWISFGKFTQSEIWNHIPEFVWLTCALHERDDEVADANIVVEMFNRHPNLRPYLAEVYKGLVFTTDDFTSKKMTASELIDAIKVIVINLDAECLDMKVLGELQHLVGDLSGIAEVTERERYQAEKLRALISDWIEQHADEIENLKKIGEYASKLKDLIQTGEINRLSTDNVLSLFDDAVRMENLYQQTRIELNQALNEEDFASVRNLTDTSESRKKELDAIYSGIDTGLSKLSGVEKLKAAEAEAEVSSEPESEEDVSEDGNAVNLGPAPVHEVELVTESSSYPVSDVSLEPEGDTVGKEALDTRSYTEETKPAGIENISVTRIEREITIAIENHRFALAFHFARAEPKALPSASAIKLVACNYATDDSVAVAAELPKLADALRQEIGTVHQDGESNREPPCAYVALLACAALAPALAAPGGPVRQLLLELDRYLGDNMPSLRELIKATAEFSALGFHLPAGLLSSDDPLDKWKEEENSIRRDVESWIANSKRVRIKYQRATAVWKRMLDVWEEHGERASIGWVLETLREPANGVDAGLVLRRINHWRDNGNREIDRIDREKYRGPRIIEGAARMNLRNKIDEAVNLADRWYRLNENRPTDDNEFQKRKSRALRDVVRREADQAINEIDRFSRPWECAASKLISKYSSMLEESAPDKSDLSMSLPDLLNGWLLLDPDIHFDEAGGVIDLPLDINRLINLSNLSPDFGSAAVERARRRDFRGSGDAVAFAHKHGLLGDEDADDISAQIEEEKERAVQKVEERIGKTNERLDAAYARGSVPREVFDQLTAVIPSSDFRGIVSDENRPFDDAYAALDIVGEEINKAEEKTGDRLRQSLATLNISPEAKGRIEGVIGERRYSVAEDYIERAGRGEGIPKVGAEISRPFDDFFPKFVDDYVSFHDDFPDAFERVRHAVKNPGRAGPFDATGLAESALRDADRLLDQWAKLRTGKAVHGILQALLDSIGFAETEVNSSRDRRAWMLKSKPISNRDDCPLPDFGSRAQGRYRLLVIEDHRTEEKIVQEVEEKFSVGSPPNIVLFLNVLDTDARRTLAFNLNPERCRPTLVLDEALVVFLAAQQRGRLAAFLNCASAFTFAQPFDPDATEVPPEMFFGRESERRAILAMSGSAEITHLVYGGRRMGKTALLANIVQTYRIQEPSWLVSLINLKGTGIGGLRLTNELWKEIAARLAEQKIVKSETIRPKSIEDGVRDWLEGDPDRRILLLVDEADDFLQADGRDRYRILEEVKKLMDVTGRRFKVVFAGLHNVQRTARDPNTPFAHLGEPVRIGPMLLETDPGKIEDLISGPLEALGYRFASMDSVIRIAAETNYYPALVQQFCKELLRELRRKGHVSRETGPPYIIPPETVDQVLDSRETRDRIRNLFLWTIQLDPRYEFLTYLIARRSFDNGSAQLRSVPIDYIRQMALKEWRAGFESDSTFLTFQVLLEEMVGLGILRKVGNREDYAIRTRNLRMLLGNDEEIERRLSDAIDRPPPPKFDSLLFRNKLDDGAPSPLTAGQENQILSGRKVVGLVFGTKLGGLDRVDEALDKAQENRSVKIRVHKCISTSMDVVLKRISRSRAAGIDIVLIDARGDWRPELVDHAAAFVARLDHRIRTIRPVFLLGPKEAWTRLEKTTWLDTQWPLMDRSDVEIQEVWLAPCAKDFARTWLRDWETPAYAELEDPHRAIDPLWPVVAQAAAENKSKSITDAIDAALSGSDFVSDVFIGLETRKALSLLVQFPDDSMVADVLCELAENSIDPETMVRVFDWGSRLGILHSDEQGHRLDSTYAEGLGTVFEE